MGIGRYDSGVFTLVVSLRHDADIARIDEWRASFQRASQLLFDATVGQHRLGGYSWPTGRWVRQKPIAG